MVNVRMKNSKDRESLYNLIDSVNNSSDLNIHKRPGGINKLVDRLMERDELIIAEKGNTLIGQIAFVKQGKTLHLNIASVLPDYRGSTTLYKMIKKLKSYCEENKISKISTVTIPRSYSGRILEKRGFVKTGKYESPFLKIYFLIAMKLILTI